MLPFDCKMKIKDFVVFAFISEEFNVVKFKSCPVPTN